MSHERVIKQVRENLVQLSIEVRQGSRHELRTMLLSASTGVGFVLAMSWVVFRLFF